MTWEILFQRHFLSSSSYSLPEAEPDQNLWHLPFFQGVDFEHFLVKDDWNLNPGIGKGSSCNTNFLLKSVDFEHFLVKDDWNLNPGMGKGGSCNANFLLKIVDFEHFLVKDDWNLNAGIGNGGSCNISTICCVEI